MTALSFDILGRDKASQAFDKVAKSADRTERKFGLLAARTKHLTAGISVGFGKVAAAMGGIAVGGFLKDAVGQASNLGETMSKSATVFGKSNSAILLFAKNAPKALGQSKQEAIGAAAQFGNMFTQLGIGQKSAASMSTQMVRLASDFASFHNADITEVLESQQAAFRGEFDSIQKFVPTINAAAVEQEGLRLKLAGSTKELTAQDKAVAVQSLLMRGAGKATGDFARTSGGLANQQRILSAQFTDFKASVGQIALPLITKIVTVINERGIPILEKGRMGVAALGAAFRGEGITSDGFVGAMERIGVGARAAFDIFKTSVLPGLKEFGGFLTKSVIPALGKTAQFIGRNKDFFIPFAVTIGAIVVGLKAWAAVQAILNVVMAANPIGLLIVGIAALVAGLIYAYKHSDKFREIVDKVGKGVKVAFGAVVDFGKKVVEFFKDNWKNLPLLLLGPVGIMVFIFKALPGKVKDAIGDAAKALVQKGKDFFQGLIDGIWSIAKGIDSWMMRAPVAKLLAPWYGAIKWLIGPGKKFISGFLNGVIGVAKGVGSWMMRNVINPTVGVFTRAGSWLVGHGKNFIAGLINGVVAYMRAIKGIGTWVYNKVIVPAVTPFLKAGGWLVQHGKNLIAGLFSGVVQHMKGVGTWVKAQVVDPIVSAVKKFFGIKSPSTVFAGIGGNLVAGLMRGLSSTSGAAIAKKVFGDMPSALRSIVGKGLISVSNLPKKALDALGSAVGIGAPIGGPSGNQSNEGVVRTLAAQYGWATGAQWNSLRALIMGESGFRNTAQNPTSSAYGLFQFLDSTWGTVGATKTSDPWAQTVAGLKYIARSYGSPANAYAKWSARSPHWYGNGGLIAEEVLGVGLRSGRKYGFGENGAEVVTPMNRLRSLKPGGGGGTVVLEFRSDGSPHMEWLITQFRKYVRINGGDVQVVLGS